MGSPKQANAVLILGRAEARVAFMPQSGIRCDCVAERENFGGRLISIIVRKLRFNINQAASELWWLITFRTSQADQTPDLQWLCLLGSVEVAQMDSIARVHTYARYYFIVLVSLFVSMVTSYCILLLPIQPHHPFSFITYPV